MIEPCIKVRGVWTPVRQVAAQAELTAAMVMRLANDPVKSERERIDSAITFLFGARPAPKTEQRGRQSPLADLFVMAARAGVEGIA